MPRLADDRRAQLDALTLAQHGLVTAAQLRVLGIEPSSVAHRLGSGDRWRRVLPGIYLTHRGQPDRDQRRRAAILYAGRDAVLSGTTALALHGSRVADRRTADPMLVLVPHHRQRSSNGFVVVERTIRPPSPRSRDGLPLAPPSRAAIDAGRRIEVLGDVRALLSDVVQTGLVTVGQLDAELAVAQRRGTRLVRRALSELRAGTRSAPEAMLRDLWLASGLDEPLWNPRLETASGAFLAQPDAYVPSVGLAVEVDSEEFHFAAADWKLTMERHARMTARGLIVLHVPPSRLASAGARFMGEVGEVLRVNAGRPTPSVRVLPTS